MTMHTKKIGEVWLLFFVKKEQERKEKEDTKADSKTNEKGS